MGCWKCSCGRYVDTNFDRCFFCMRPKPGTVKQGDIEVNCTVDTLLDLTRDELAARVADVLFES